MSAGVARGYWSKPRLFFHRMTSVFPSAAPRGGSGAFRLKKRPAGTAQSKEHASQGCRHRVDGAGQRGARLDLGGNNVGSQWKGAGRKGRCRGGVDRHMDASSWARLGCRCRELLVCSLALQSQCTIASVILLTFLCPDLLRPKTSETKYSLILKIC